MKSLFAKILAWFLLATLLTGVSAALVNVLIDDNFPPERLLRGLLEAHLEKAAEAYESGGPSALSAYLESVDEAIGGPLQIVDAEGRDLRTGEQWRAKRAVETRAGKPWGGPPWAVAATADGRYRAALPIPPRALRSILLRPANLSVLALAAALCWPLARHISRPVGELRRAVERFGEGDTGVLLASKREDELGELARSFDRMAGRIRSLAESQRQLLLDISHELRSPLTRLMLAAELLRNDPADKEALGQIEKEARRMNQLVSELLLASRLEAGEGRERFEPLMLDALVGEVADSVRFEAEANGRRIALERAAPAPVTGDGELLRRAVENVLRNAVRHTPEGTAVQVALEKDGSSVLLRVRDHGAGVPDGALPRLFDPFFRADSVRERTTGGVGLGLTIARRAVEAHGGSIEALNAAPGLEVVMRLPLISR